MRDLEFIEVGGVRLPIVRQETWRLAERAFRQHRDPKMKVTLAKVPWEDDRTRTTERAEQG